VITAFVLQFFQRGQATTAALAAAGVANPPAPVQDIGPLNMPAYNPFVKQYNKDKADEAEEWTEEQWQAALEQARAVRSQKRIIRRC
jgi:hypothetical protein